MFCTQNFSVLCLCKLHSTFLKALVILLSVEVVYLAQLGRWPPVTFMWSCIIFRKEMLPSPKTAVLHSWAHSLCGLLIPRPFLSLFVMLGVLGHWWYYKTCPHSQFQMIGPGMITWYYPSQPYYSSALTLFWNDSSILPPESANPLPSLKGIRLLKYATSTLK